MANNRIYLRCMGCGDVLYLGKTYDMGYWWERYDGIPLEEKLNKFYEKHNYCNDARVTTVPYDIKAFPLPDGFNGCDGAFDIVYEQGW